MVDKKKKKKKQKDYAHTVSKNWFLAPLYGTGYAEVGAIQTPAGSVTVSGPTAAAFESTEVVKIQRQVRKDGSGEYEEIVMHLASGDEYVLAYDDGGFVISKNGRIAITGQGDPWEEWRQVTGIPHDEIKQIISEVKAYHGSRDSEAKFDVDIDYRHRSKAGSVNYGPGVYFAENPSDASSYAGEDGTVHIVDLDIKNPFVVTNFDHAKQLADAVGLEIEKRDSRDYYLDILSKLSQASLDARVSGKNVGIFGAEDLNQELKDLGFDGIHVDHRDWWVSFEPKRQVKYHYSK